MRRITIGIMGAGEAAQDADLAAARSLGELVAREGWVVLTGGRDQGVMQAASEGAKSIAGSLTIGIVPTATPATVSAAIDVAICTGMGSARNNINVLSSDVVIACGHGGAGTVSEIALAVKAGTPVIVIGADATARAFLTRLGFIHFVESAEEAVAQTKRLLHG